MKRLFSAPVREAPYHLYLLLSALSACAYGSFLNVYLGELGFDVFTIGLFSTVPSLLGMVLQPMLALWADRARRKRGLMLLLLGLGILSMGLMWFLRPREGATALSAGILMGVQTLYLALTGAANSLNTAVLMEHLARRGASGRYGRIRVSWTVGYAIAGVWVGALNEGNPAAFIPYAAITAALSMAVIPLLPWEDAAPAARKEAGGLSWRALAGYRELWWLVFIVFLVGLANSFTYTFLPTFFMTLPGADQEIFGWCISLRTVTEVPVLFAMGWILGRLGIKKTLMIPALTTVLRWALVAAFPDPAMILATQLLHGFGYVVYSVAMTRYVADRLPAQIGSTAQNVVALLTVTAPTLVGGLVGGLVIDTWALGYMGCLWGIVGLSVIAAVLLGWLTVRMPDRPATRPER